MKNENLKNELKEKFTLEAESNIARNNDLVVLNESDSAADSGATSISSPVNEPTSNPITNPEEEEEEEIMAASDPMTDSWDGKKAKNFWGSMKKLIRFFRGHYPAIIISLIIATLSCVLSIIAPNIMERLTNEIDVVRMGLSIDLYEVARFGIILVIVYVLAFLTDYLQSYILAVINQKGVKKMRTKLLEKINVLPLKYHDKHAFGNTLSRVTNDTDILGEGLSNGVAGFMTTVIMLVGIVIAMFVSEWRLALVALGVVPISFFVLSIVMKFSQKHFVAQQKNLGLVNGKVEENFSSHTIVKAFRGEHKSLRSFDIENKKLAKSQQKAEFFSGIMFPLMMIMGAMGFVAICIVGGVLIYNGSVEGMGVIIAFMMFMRMFQANLGQLAQTLQSLQSTAAASERVFELLEEGEVSGESEKTLKIENVKGAVEFKNVKFGYDPEKVIIHNFSASIKAGQKVAIVGPTGAGKTTLVNLLMRFYELCGGEILIDNININDMKREDVRALFGMVLQDTWLFEGTIRENIVYAKEGVTEEEIIAAAKAANIDHFIRTLPNGYDMMLSDEVSISGGQRQLLTIARAIVQNSPMLILDEATSNVDTRTEKLIQDAMDTLIKGRTSFVIAHRLSTIKNADIILVLKEGDIVESGTHDELLGKDGFYAELYNSMFDATIED
ncbi:MAG: ABC transporter ATP-binding protein/permease [Firmicutes bacterium]|nr:ABC transporter ATP-binding protein/permease [Bacillota bacterium]